MFLKKKNKKINIDLNHFIEAQENIYKQVLKELKNGRKRSHWMWFIFPQFDGLGRSSMARRYAIKSRDEAEAYLVHEVLGQRFIECCELLLKIDNKSIGEIMGYPDNLKLYSSLTLFEEISTNVLFTKVLEKYFGEQRDEKTLELLKSK